MVFAGGPDLDDFAIRTPEIHVVVRAEGCRRRLNADTFLRTPGEFARAVDASPADVPQRGAEPNGRRGGDLREQNERLLRKQAVRESTVANFIGAEEFFVEGDGRLGV